MVIELEQVPGIYIVSVEDNIYMRDQAVWFVDTEEGWMFVADSEGLEAQFQNCQKE